MAAPSSASELSYSELGAWHEFTSDRDSFFQRAAVVTVGLPEAFPLADVPELVAAVSARHDIFRTVYEVAGGVPSRRVLEQHTYVIGESRPAATAPERAGHRLAPEDLVSIWVRKGAQASLSFGLHEMITDTVSCARLVAEVGQLASGAARPAQRPLPSYAEYAREERQRRVPPDLAVYWRNQLSGLDSVPVAVPPDGPDPSGDQAGERIQILPDHLTQALRDVCRAYRMSPFMVVAALVNMTVATLYDVGDITLTTMASNRTSKFAAVQGNFSNLTVLRTVLPPGPTFAGVLTATQTAVLGALRHQPMPYLQLAELTDGPWPRPRVRVHYLPRRAHHYGATLDAKPSGAAWNEETDFAGWPLDLGFAEDSRGRVAIWASYDPALFTHALVRALVGGCSQLLERVTASASLTCGDLRRQLSP